MWISKKKYEARERDLKHEAFLESLRNDSQDRQWEDIEKLKKQVKKLKKTVKNGW
jgi:hypothetical protein